MQRRRLTSDVILLSAITFAVVRIYVGCCLPAAVVLGEPRGLEVTAGKDHTPGQVSDDVPAGDFLLVFATIGDSHISARLADTKRTLKALSISSELLRNYVRDINSHMPPVDFAFQLGDLTDSGTPEEFAIARCILDTLRCPLYPVVGNHDNMQNDNKQGWRHFAGMDSTLYAFDKLGFHFIVIDCTSDPYVRPRVHCDSTVRAWVARDLALNSDKPAFVISHYNMWQRAWSPVFASKEGYHEYKGMPQLREVLTRAGNVVAVINGHVHANRVEVHDGIYYIDIGATLVGRPSIRYFYLYPDRVEVTYAYISNDMLLNQVEYLAHHCMSCFDRVKICDFIDGTDSDKRFTIPVKTFLRRESNPRAVPQGSGLVPD
jgi:Icc protein